MRFFNNEGTYSISQVNEVHFSVPCSPFPKPMFRVRLVLLKQVFAFLLAFLITVCPTVLFAQTMPQQLVQQGKIYYEAGKLKEAIVSLQKAVELFRQENHQENIAITLTNLGNIQLTLGKAQQALETWQQAQTVYENLANYSGVILSQINQSKALQALGLYPRACNTLIAAFQVTSLRCSEVTGDNLQLLVNHSRTPSEAIQVVGLRAWGNLFRSMGRLEDSTFLLQQAIEIDSKTKDITQLSLANTLRARGNLERDRRSQPEYQHLPWRYEAKEIHSEAEKFYQQADKLYLAIIQDTSLPLGLRTRTQINHLSLLLERGQQPQPQELQINLEVLPLSRTRVYLRINLAKSLAFWEQQSSLLKIGKRQEARGKRESWRTVTNLLNTALNEAQELADSYAQAYALGNLAGLEEYFASVSSQPKSAQQWREQAQQLTQQALLIVQPQGTPDAAYQWQWQLGRLLAGQGKREEAITAYESAAQTLDQVRRDLLTINSDVQFSFRDNVEPLYRQLVSLLLPKGETNPPQEHLKKSLYYVESLQLAELENFLRCTIQSQDNEGLLTPEITTQEAQIELLIKRIERVIQNDPEQKTAFLYPILLPEQVAVILKLPNQERLVYQVTAQDKNQVEKIVQAAQTTLYTKHRLRPNQKQPLKELYQLLLAKSIPSLEQAQIKTLIFILDNIFRSIPMSTLHNGEDYIVAQDYATLVVPTVQLLQPLNFQAQNLTALIGGAIEKRDNYNPLEVNVKAQIAAITKILPNYKILTDGNFTKTAIKQELADNYYPIIHLVTHGQFSSNPQETFILTDDKAATIEGYSLNINEFENLLKTTPQKQSIELLVLSACESAEGDNRAVLGIAGVAVKSGAKGTIAPLWTVDQASSNLIIEKFYENLVNKEVSKAEALHLAQQYLLEESRYTSPYHWSPFVLVGN